MRGEPVETLKPDLCVIGAGSAGLSVAAIAASFGVPVVLIESGRMGGDCLNVGCVPSKALIAAADRAPGDASRPARFGIGRGDPQVDFARVRDHVRGVDRGDRAERFGRALHRPGRAGHRGRGALHRCRDTVAAGGHAIKARRFVLATGSRPALPPIPGLDAVPYLTNETVFDLAERPERLVVIGGGPIGVELAQAYRRLGAEVTVLEAAPRLLAREDPEMAAVVERALLREGVELRIGARSSGSSRARRASPSCSAEGGGGHRGQPPPRRGRPPGRSPRGSASRRPASRPTRAGSWSTRACRTTNRRVYAIGDCAGGAAAPYRFTHVANYHAGLVIRSALFRLPVRVDTTRRSRASPTPTRSSPRSA